LEKHYTKKITPVYNTLEKISFKKKDYTHLDYIKYQKRDNPEYVEDKDDYFTLTDLEEWNIFDITRYNKPELLEMVKDFL